MKSETFKLQKYQKGTPAQSLKAGIKAQPFFLAQKQ